MKSLTSLFYPLLIIWIVVLWTMTNGYGVEEDSLTAVYTAFEIWDTGEYHMSRLPGHPVFEYLLAITWPLRTLMWPLFIASGVLFSAIFTRKILRRYTENKLKHFLLLGIFLTPVMALSLGETMEYTLALATLTMAWWYGLTGRAMLAAVFLALSTGLRLPNLIFGLPILILIFRNGSFLQALLFSALSFGLTAILYIPVYSKFGVEFFNTYELPYPPLLKVIYKGTIGVWGILGGLGILIAALGIDWKKLLKVKRLEAAPYVIAAIFSVMLYLTLPEKSAFLLPFSLLFGAIILRYSKRKFAIVGFGLLLLNPLFLGTDLVDQYRGIPEENADIVISTSSQDLGVQLIFPNPREKQDNKLETVEYLGNLIRNTEGEVLVVTGWWYPFFQVEGLENGQRYFPERINYVYYADESLLLSALQDGKTIYYTPEAQIFNAQRYDHDLLARYGKPLIPSP